MSDFEKRYGKGISHYNASAFQKAEKIFSELLEQNRTHAELNYMLGLTVFKTGKSQAGLDFIRKAIDLDKTSPVFTNTLGALLDHLGRTPEAIPWYEKTLELEPDKVLTYNNLGFALRRVGRLDDARGWYEKAVNIDTKNAMAHKGLGDVYSDMGKTAEARACLLKALEIDPDYVDALVSLAQMLQSLGRLDEARELAVKALNLQPENMSVHIMLAHLEKNREGDARFEILETAKAKGRLTAMDRLRLFSALGKMYRDIKAYDQAFENYRSCNELRKELKGADFSIVAEKKRVDIFCKTFTPAFIEKRAAYGVKTDRPVFVLGMPRSGTTLVEQIIAGHPDGYGAGELPFIHSMAEIVIGKTPVDRLPQHMESFTEGHIDKLAGLYLEKIGQEFPEGKRVVDKMPHNFQHVWLISLLFKNAKIIHCVRDPMDTCLSCYFTEFERGHGYKNDLETLGRYYRLYERLMAHWKEVVPIPMLEVKYEEVIADQEGISREILAFCGLEWDDRCLDFSSERSRVRTSSVVQVRQKIYTTSVGRWKRYEKHLKPLVAILQNIQRE